MSDIKIIYKPLGELKPYENNPRDNRKAIDAVAKSIKRFGVRSPAIIDKNSVVIAGHTRILAAQKLGLKEFPCVVADDLTPEQVQALRLMDNRAQEESQWDTELLANEFKALKGLGFDLADTGFTPFEIDSLTFDFTVDEGTAGEDYTGEVPPMPHDETAAGEYGYMYPADAPEAHAEPAGTYHPDEFNRADEMPHREPEYTHDAYTAEPASQPYEPFVCIICCADIPEREFVRNLIRETDELRNHYTMSEILERLER